MLMENNVSRAVIFAQKCEPFLPKSRNFPEDAPESLRLRDFPGLLLLPGGPGSPALKNAKYA